jgi:hypothetical protein
MIFIFRDGKLGNQLFQYSVMRKKFPRHKQLLIGFGDTEKVMAGVQATFFPQNLIPRALSPERIGKFFYLMAKLRLIGLVSESSECGVYRFIYKPGLFRSLITLKSSYFQDKSQLHDLKPDFYIREEVKREAIDWLKQNLPSGNFTNLVFVHVRRGDYLYWPTSQFPAVLDIGWYKEQINLLEKELSSPCFVVITDDFRYVVDNFEAQKNIVFSCNSPEVDFALMTLCDSGILSASSFAWWGAWLSKNSQVGPGIYLAPKFWAGHASQQWFPVGFITDWITYVR